jgi:hypothetical protein
MLPVFPNLKYPTTKGMKMYHYDPDWVVNGGPMMESFCIEAGQTDDMPLKLERTGLDPNPWRIVYIETNHVLADGSRAEMLSYLSEYTRLYDDMIAEAAK